MFPRFTQHLAVQSTLSLKDFCSKFQKILALPDFEFGYENETEWGLVLFEGIEFNVSRPFEEGTLQLWDETVPKGCNFGIALSVTKNCPQKQNVERGLTELVPNIGQKLADHFDSSVYHHRTWLEVGKNLAQEKVFNPKS